MALKLVAPGLLQAFTFVWIAEQGGAELPLPQPQEAEEVHADRHGDNGAVPGPAAHKESLLAAAAKARKVKPAETDAERLLKEEQEIMKTITQRMALKSVKENAQVRSREQELAVAVLQARDVQLVFKTHHESRSQMHAWLALS